MPFPQLWTLIADVAAKVLAGARAPDNQQQWRGLRSIHIAAAGRIKVHSGVLDFTIRAEPCSVPCVRSRSCHVGTSSFSLPGFPYFPPPLPPSAPPPPSVIPAAPPPPSPPPFYHPRRALFRSLCPDLGLAVSDVFLFPPWFPISPPPPPPPKKRKHPPPSLTLFRPSICPGLGLGVSNFLLFSVPPPPPSIPTPISPSQPHLSCSAVPSVKVLLLPCWTSSFPPPPPVPLLSSPPPPPHPATPKPQFHLLRVSPCSALPSVQVLLLLSRSSLSLVPFQVSRSCSYYHDPVLAWFRSKCPGLALIITIQS